MTVIVGVKKQNSLAIAADSQFNLGSLKKHSKYVENGDKILKVGSSYIGITGWGTSYLIAEHLFKKHKKKIDLSSKMKIFESLLRIQKILKNEYFIETNEGDDQPVESNQLDGLIINNSGIFSITSYRDVEEYGKFWAIGSGRSYALGAMFACYDNLESAKKIAEIGVNAACEFNDGCGTPIQILEKKTKNI